MGCPDDNQINLGVLKHFFGVRCRTKETKSSSRMVRLDAVAVGDGDEVHSASPLELRQKHISEERARADDPESYTIARPGGRWSGIRGVHLGGAGHGRVDRILNHDAQV